MLNDPLVQELLNNVVKDEENLKIVECLLNGTDKDEEIAEKTGIKLNIVRKVLYKLYDAGLASYKRSKDPETQWFTYSWEFDSDEVSSQIESNSKNMIKSLEKLLEYEKNNMFFVCPENHSRFDFDEAAEKGFLCPECGDEVKFEDNHKLIEKIKEEIESCKETYDLVKSNNAK
ncbi:MAG: transcription factor E [Methanobrevibacter sp.]|nr:transcription factor E [Methanobrevibacter sp.]